MKPLLLFSALALCRVHNMVQITRSLFIFDKKKPPANAVVDGIALAGFL
tara:strand:+ start:308 stop:454 length:147 start_codon:yes stop_codon:yes gene_type:complete